MSQTPGRLGAPAAAPAPAFPRAISVAQNILDESFMRGVFNRHADSNSKRELSSLALIAALKEAGAPLVLSSSFSEDDIFRRADANLSGAVDFEEYERCIKASVFATHSIFEGSCARLGCRTSYRCFWRTTTLRYRPSAPARIWCFCEDVIIFADFCSCASCLCHGF